MSITVLILTSLSQAASVQHPVLEAFKAACIPQRSSMEGLSRSLEGKGWVRSRADVHPIWAWRASMPPLGSYLTWGDATGSTWPAKRSIYWVKGIGPGRLFLVQTESSLGEWSSFPNPDPFTQNPVSAVEMTTYLNCTVSDFESTSAIRPELVNKWAGRRPKHWSRRPDGWESGRWDVSGVWPGVSHLRTEHWRPRSGVPTIETSVSIDWVIATRKLPFRPGYKFKEAW